jgi:hypothetical protein
VGRSGTALQGLARGLLSARKLRSPLSGPFFFARLSDDELSAIAGQARQVIKLKVMDATQTLAISSIPFEGGRECRAC